MEKVKPFGDKSNEGRTKPFSVIIALVMALAVIIPHVLGMEPDVVNIINDALPEVSLVLVAVLMVLLIVGLFGGKAEWGSSMSGWVAFGSFVLVLFIFGRAAGWFLYLPNWLYWLDNPDTQAMIIVFAVFAIIIWYITKEPTKDSDKGKTLKNFSNSWGELFGKTK
jgi:hypothetical protein